MKTGFATFFSFFLPSFFWERREKGAEEPVLPTI
jgi:hypothetical protein